MSFKLMADMDICSISEAADTVSLVLACKDIVAGSGHVKLNLPRLEVFEDVVRTARPTSWSWVFDPRAATDGERLFDAAFNASLNGGYFYRDGPSGEIRQWQVDGSGSQALTVWIRGLREKRLLPGWDQGGLSHEGSHYLEMIRDELEGLPYAEERIEVCAQFCDPGKRAELRKLASDVFVDGGMRVNLEHVDRLADIYPAGMRDDPLRKKAILAFLLLAGNMASRGLAVDWSAAAPMDYQLPRILEWKGVIEVSPALSKTLRCPMALMPIDSEQVYHMRAAALVAVERLSAITGVPSWLVDSALFTCFRKDPAFIAGSLPPMRVDGAWF